MKSMVLGFLFLSATLPAFGQLSEAELARALSRYKYKKEVISQLQAELRNSKKDSSAVPILSQLIQQYSNNLDSSIYYAFMKLNFSRKINFRGGELQALVAITSLLRHHGILLKAFNIDHKGLALSRKYRDKTYEAIFLGEIGIFYRETGAFTHAMDYLKESRILFDSIGHDYSSTYQMSNMGEVFLLKNEFDSAMMLCHSALKRSEAISDPDYFWVVFYATLNVGNIFLATGNYDSAIYYLKHAKSIGAFHSHQFASNLSLARAFQKLKLRDSCLYYANEANRVAIESGVYSFNAAINEYLGGFYGDQDVRKSVAFAKASLAYKDSLYRQSTLVALENFDELDEQEKLFEIQSAKAAYQFQARLIGLLIGVVLLLIVVALVVRTYRHKQKLAELEREKEHFELEKAKEVDKVKSTFFANISHEFRTPLTLIKGPAQEMMEEFADHPKVKERMNLVQRNADLVLKLINQLLDLAKLESGTLTVETSQNDLNEFLRVVTSSFSSLAFQKNITLETEFPRERMSISFDKGKVETILINLINNAIKFTPAGGTVAVRTELKNLQLNKDAHSAGAPLWRRGVGGEVTITVSDTGIGIDKDQHEKIFERFHQVSEAHKEVGTGIGLSLVKELVALMKGTLSLKSEPGKGSEFTVTLPVEVTGRVTELEADEKVAALLVSDEITSEHGLESPDNKPHILVVEDNSDLRKFIIGSLGSEFHFQEAADGKEGLRTAIDDIPDLIISDVMMPEMDGITMTGKLKKDARTSHIPLILLTAKTTDESKLSGLSTGADDYLTKPFNKQELLLKVRNSIALQVRLREKIRLELLKESPKVEVQSADEKFLMKVKETILARLNDGQLSVESLAEEIALSRSQLLRKVTALTGVSVNELIRTFRLQKAAQLLEQNWGPVTQVAYEVGFSNLSYFSKVFKEQYGVLPSEYLVAKAKL